MSRSGVLVALVSVAIANLGAPGSSEPLPVMLFGSGSTPAAVAVVAFASVDGEPFGLAVRGNAPYFVTDLAPPGPASPYWCFTTIPMLAVVTPGISEPRHYWLDVSGNGITSGDRAATYTSPAQSCRDLDPGELAPVATGDFAATEGGVPPTSALRLLVGSGGWPGHELQFAVTDDGFYDGNFRYDGTIYQPEDVVSPGLEAWAPDSWCVQGSRFGPNTGAPIRVAAFVRDRGDGTASFDEVAVVAGATGCGPYAGPWSALDDGDFRSL